VVDRRIKPVQRSSENIEPKIRRAVRTGTIGAPTDVHAGQIGRLANRMEFPMSTKIKVAAFALAALATVGTIASSSQAQAKGPGLGFGIAAGVIGAAVVGSAIAANEAGYYDHGYGYRRCGWVRQFDAYGNYVGRVRTCNY
jgi:hypothetical protein